MSSEIKQVVPAPQVPGVARISSEAPREMVPAVASSSSSRNSVTLDQVRDAVDSLNRHFSVTRSDIRFSIEQDIGMVVVSVVDSESGAVLLQLPTEQVLQTAREVQRGQPGDNLIKAVA